MKRTRKKKTNPLKEILLAIFSCCMVAFVLLWVHTNYLIHPVAGTSMEGSLQDGDYVLVNKKSPISRYSIIGFSMPKESGMFVKRIIGLPGDAMLIQGNRLILSIGDKEFSTTYIFEIDPRVAHQLSGKTTIPKDYYFVLGDHTAVSKDSRSFGLVQLSDIEGKVQYSLYPFYKLRPIN
ncbi:MULTISPECIES: signal peptidase I [Enterococcus]|uniref:Signal peptidase I n=1 Tax=Candidatus Enterococcus ferrettii TaxID=2815324 RepID=A0ABV0EN10_9ENTE|nr:signal peptidase I [Enterococcus sp. 665A]MBO1343056.1 signal peptidase I [Enterococcus sp. 665A]